MKCFLVIAHHYHKLDHLWQQNTHTQSNVVMCWCVHLFVFYSFNICILNTLVFLIMINLTFGSSWLSLVSTFGLRAPLDIKKKWIYFVFKMFIIGNGITKIYFGHFVWKYGLLYQMPIYLLCGERSMHNQCFMGLNFLFK